MNQHSGNKKRQSHLRYMNANNSANNKNGGATSTPTIKKTPHKPTRAMGRFLNFA